MADLKKINEAFTKYLRLQTFPVAVKMCKSGEELPEKVKIPERDLGLNVSLCHSIAMSRKYGWTMAAGKKQSCWAAGISMGFLPVKPDVADGTFQESIGLWGQSKEEAAAGVRDMTKFDYGLYQYALISPLHRANFEPDVVLTYATPAQIWVLMSCYLMAAGQKTLSCNLSIGAGCTTYITKAMKTDEAQFALIGTGERLGPNTQDQECMLSIPASKLDQTAEGLAFGHQLGVFRYPIPSTLRYNSQHPPGYDKMLAHLSE